MSLKLLLPHSAGVEVVPTNELLQGKRHSCIHAHKRKSHLCNAIHTHLAQLLVLLHFDVEMPLSNPGKCLMWLIRCCYTYETCFLTTKSVGSVVHLAINSQLSTKNV